MELRKLSNGLNIAYNKKIDIDNIDDEFIDSIFYVVARINKIEDNYLDNLFFKSNGNYPDLIRFILKNSNLLQRKEIFTNINTNEFISNVRYIYKLYNNEVSNDDLLEIFKNNPVLFKYNIDNIKNNYNFLRKQQILFNEDLDRFYIGNNIKNIDTKLKEILLRKEVISKPLLQLAITPSDKNKELIIKNLKFIVRVNGLRDYNDIDMEAKEYFNSSLFDNLTRYDNKKLQHKSLFINNLEYKHYFDGVKSNICEIIYKMNPNFINDLNRLSVTDEYKTFIYSLKTIKNWDKYDDYVKRASDLKDEFITRVLYGVLKKSYLNYINNDVNNKELVKKLVGKEYKSIDCSNINIDKDMLIDITTKNMDNYFMINRHKSSAETMFVNKLKSRIYEIYKASNVYIEDVKISSKVNNDDYENFLEKINSDLLNQYPLDFIRNKIVDDTENIISKYSSVKGLERSKLLHKIFKTINYYLLLNNQYEIQNYMQKVQGNFKDMEDVTVLSKKVFNLKNTKLNGMDRILYCLYNSNKIAHSIEKDSINNLNKFSLLSDGEYKNKKEIFIKKYNFLSRYGITVDFINESIEDYISNKNLTIYNLIDKNDKEGILFYLNNKIQDDNNITNDNIDEIINYLVKIKNNDSNDINKEIFNKEIRDNIYLLAREDSLLFNIKRFLTNEVINMTSKKSNKELENMTQDDKTALFMKNGYIAEYQLDNSNNKVLVCYDKKFNNAFSVHVIDNNKQFNTKFIKKNQVIAHHKVPVGLIQNQNNANVNIYSELKLTSGFNGEYDSNIANESKIYNTININLKTIGNVIKNPAYMFKKVRELVKTKKDVPIKEIDFSGKNTVYHEANKAIDNSMNNIINDMLNNKNITIEKSRNPSTDETMYKFNYKNSSITVDATQIGDSLVEKISLSAKK